jgi:hypothetical protein
LGTFPRLSILVEGGELDLARSVITDVEDGVHDMPAIDPFQAEAKLNHSIR